MELEKVDNTINENLKFVTNRKGEKEDLDIEQIRQRLDFLCFELDRNFVDVDLILKKVTD